MSETILQPCEDCGRMVETSTSYRAPRPRRCPECATAIKKLRDRIRHKATYQPTAIVKVVGISDRVRDAEMRFLLYGYKGSIFKWWDFRESLKAGVLDGLTIVKNGKHYEVTGRELTAQSLTQREGVTP